MFWEKVAGFCTDRGSVPGAAGAGANFDVPGVVTAGEPAMTPGPEIVGPADILPGILGPE